MKLTLNHRRFLFWKLLFFHTLFLCLLGSLLLLPHRTTRTSPSMAPPEPKNKITTSSNVNSLKPTFFHTKAFILSLEVNNDKMTSATKRSFRKFLNNRCQIKKKHINFQQYFPIHESSRKIAIRETASDSVFILNDAFTSEDNYFKVHQDEACNAFNAIMLDCGYTQNWNIMTQNVIKHFLNKTPALLTFFHLLSSLFFFTFSLDDFTSFLQLSSLR